MLLIYFLRQLYRNFFLLFVVLIVVFTSVNLLMRLPTLPSMAFVPAIFIYLIPLVAQFAMPVAASLAVQATMGELYANSSVLFLRFLPSARSLLHYSVLIFAFSLLSVAIPLAFSWAPQSYEKAKRLIVAFAQEHLSRLESGKFHYLSSNAMVFFKRKQQKLLANSSQKVPCFFQIILMLHNSRQQQHVITAQEGILNQGVLILNDGTIESRFEQKYYVATFEQIEIALERLVEDKKEFAFFEEGKMQLKFLTWKQIAHLRREHKRVSIELHARIIKIIWQLLLPLFSFLGFVLWGKLQRYNMMLSIGLSGGLFLFSYVLTGLAQAFWRNNAIAYGLLYGVTLLIAGGFYTIYRKSWRKL